MVGEWNSCWGERKGLGDAKGSGEGDCLCAEVAAKGEARRCGDGCGGVGGFEQGDGRSVLKDTCLIGGAWGDRFGWVAE